MCRRWGAGALGRWSIGALSALVLLSAAAPQRLSAQGTIQQRLQANQQRLNAIREEREQLQREREALQGQVHEVEQELHGLELKQNEVREFSDLPESDEPEANDLKNPMTQPRTGNEPSKAA